MYLISWEWYSHEDNVCETFNYVRENTRELLEDYYVEYANMAKEKWFRKENPRQKDSKGAEKTNVQRCRKA